MYPITCTSSCLSRIHRRRCCLPSRNTAPCGGAATTTNRPPPQIALSGQAAGAPIASPAKVGSSKNHSEPANHSGDGPANATCFLNQFRTLSPEEAEKQGINLKQQLAHKLPVGSVAFSVTLMVFGGAMLVAGWKLFTLVLFLSGFGGGFLVAFFAVASSEQGAS